MAVPKKPTPVKLFAGLLYCSEDVLEKALRVLEETFGRIDYISQEIEFTWTNYYAEEMCEKLYRKFVSFEKLIDPGILADIKIKTNEIEQRFTKEDGGRLINIDPGYIALSKLVLASAKDFSHRIYLRDGIYAEVTLRFISGKFTPLDYTYPDYRSDEYHKIFLKIREIYRNQLKNLDNL